MAVGLKDTARQRERYISILRNPPQLSLKKIAVA
jgi:hypothetical protein